MRNYLLIIAVLLSFSCQKDEQEADTEKKSIWKLSLVSGDNQSGEFNTTLKDSLVIRVTDDQNKPVKHASINFLNRKGLGKVSSQYVWTDSTGTAYVKLRLGCMAAEHQVVAYLCDENANYIDSVRFKANSVKPAKWGKACGINYDVSKIREYNNKYYVISQRQLYISTDGGTNWEPMLYLPKAEIIDIQFNSKGEMYLLTESNGIYYAANEGKYWYPINNGLTNTYNPKSFLVEDTVMYVSFYGGLFRSRNNGQSWTRLLANGQNLAGCSFIARHPSGKLYLFDNWDDLWMSADNGDNWSYVNVSYTYKGSDVCDFKIGKNGLLYIGSGDATISVISSDTYTGEVHRFYKSNSWYQTVNSIFLKDDVAYFSISGTSEPGIYTSNGWKRMDNDFTKSIQTLLLKSDGKFLVGTYNSFFDNGLYYQ